jgi:hypothetical protein
MIPSHSAFGSRVNLAYCAGLATSDPAALDTNQQRALFSDAGLIQF